MGSIIGALIVAHTPRMADEATAPAFTREMIRGMHELGEVVAELRPDVLVQASTHWVTTFNHYVLSHKRHKGILTSSEVPEIIAGVPYDFPGDAELAEAIAARGKEKMLPVICTAAEPFMLEYGTVNPIQYLTPKFDVPVVPVSSCLLADIPECIRFGEAIGGSDPRQLEAGDGRRHRRQLPRKLHAYGPSSGTGNAVVSLLPG